VQDSNGIKLVPKSEENSDTSNPVGLGLQRPIAAQSALAPYINPNVSHTLILAIFVAVTVLRENIYKCDEEPGLFLSI
jgi:hypothetical protein